MSLLCACGVKVKSPARPGRYACPRCRQALVFAPPAAPPPPQPQEPPPPPAPPRRTRSKSRKKVWWGLGAVLLVILAVASNNSKKAPPSEKKKGAEKTTTTKTSSTTQRVTMEMYNRIKEGMSYDQVCEIIGFEGEEQSRNNLAGTTTVMYRWSNSFSGMSAIFHGDSLYSKSQFGLK